MSRARLRVTFLLEDTTLFGGVKVVLHQANLLVARGHRAMVVTRQWKLTLWRQKYGPTDWIAREERWSETRS